MKKSYLPKVLSANAAANYNNLVTDGIECIAFVGKTKVLMGRIGK